MTSPSRAVRRLAFQTLFQLDARHGDADAVRDSLSGVQECSPRECRMAFALASAAYAARAGADAEFEALSPTWPASRQPAVDRAILRLAHHEIVSGAVPPRVAVDEAVELAKEFGTDKSPGFVNALLDPVLRKVEHAGPARAAADAADPTATGPSASRPEIFAAPPEA